MSALPCPRCAVAMAERTEAGIRAHRCPVCEGMWIPGNDLPAAIRLEAAEQGVQLAAVALLEGPAVPTDRTCPGCATVLERLAMRGVEVERCPACRGVFLDYGEGALITKRVMAAAAQWGPAYEALQRLVRERFRDAGRTGGGEFEVPL